MHRRTVPVLSLIMVVLAFGILQGAPAGGGGGVPQTSRDSVDWSNINLASKPLAPMTGERERPGEKAGLCGAILTCGGKGKNQTLVVHTPSGVPTAVVTHATAKKDPEAAKKTIKTACGETTCRGVLRRPQDMAKWIGEVLFPTIDLDDDGTSDETDQRILWKYLTGTDLEEALESEKKPVTAVESVVDHLQPIVVLCAKPTPPDPEDTAREIAAKRGTAGARTEPATSGTAGGGKKGQTIEEASVRIGEILSPSPVPLTVDLDKDGKVDVIMTDSDGYRYIKLSSGRIGGKTGSETVPKVDSVVDHLQPIVVDIGPVGIRKQSSEPKKPTGMFDDYPRIRIHIPPSVFEEKEEEKSLWPKFTPMGDLDGDGLPDPMYSIPKKPKVGVSYGLINRLNSLYPVPWGFRVPEVPSNYTPESVMVLQQGISPEQLEHLAMRLTGSLASGRRLMDNIDQDFADRCGVYWAEPIRRREVQKTNPNDTFYLVGKEKTKKKGGLLGKLAGGLVPNLPGGRKSLEGGRTKSKIKDQWGLRKVGFLPRSSRKSAWNVEDGSRKNVVVAVIDSGLDMTHPDGPKYVWVNRGEVPGNGVDDDRNGYVDDVHGWNFVEHNNDLTDKHGHGTFIAGIIAAKTNNGMGVAGINPGAQIMVLKVVDEDGVSNSLNVYRALRYAAAKGARIVNISLGERGVSILEQLGVNYAYFEGALIVVAAGNQGDEISHYGPAALRRVLPVAAMNFEGLWSVASNIGRNIGLMAPGEEIYSLHSKDAKWRGSGDKGKRYRKASGTSFSAPIVSGTASLLLAKNPRLTNRQIEDILLDTAKDLREPGWDNYSGAGLLSAYKALKADPKGILTLRPTEIVINRKKKKVTSVDIFGVVRGNLDSFTVGLARRKGARRWKHLSGPETRQVEYGLIARIDSKIVSRGKNFVVRITAKDKQGNSKIAELPLPLLR